MSNAPQEIHVGDTGTIFELRITQGGSALNISTATSRWVVFRKPSGGTVIGTAVFTNDGTDGKIKYTSGSADIDEVGVWRVQGHVITPVGDWRTKLGQFTVLANI